MKKKNLLSLLLAAAMLFSLTVCTPLAAFAEEPDIDAQLGLIFSKLDTLKQPDGAQTWYYTVTDLNRNGQVEFIAATQHPQDRSTNLKIWEVSKDGKALTECTLAKDPDESFPDILTDSTDTYHDVAGDAWYYMFYDNVVLSENEVYTSKSAYRMKDGVMAYMAYAIEHTVVENGARTVTHTDANGMPISPEQYNAAGVNAFSACERSNTSFDWFRAGDAQSLSRLADSFAVFTGRKSPTESFPVPKPDALTKPAATAAPVYTPTPTAVPMYTPTPTAAPAPPAPVYLSVTKNPTNENKTEGQTAMFVSCANAFESLSWTLVAPNGGEYTTANFRNIFPRASVSGEYSTTLSIANVEKDMNNWGAYCTFYYQGQTARTATAYMYVTAKQEPKAAPSGTYSGSVTDWSYNTVTVKVEGKVSVTVPYGLCDIEGDLYYGAPASILWDGQNVTYCYIRGDIPTPQPSYGSMSGTAYDDSLGQICVILQNGDTVYVSKSVCSIYGQIYAAGGGAPCIVYYTGYPSASNIYLCEVYGYETDYGQGGWAGSQYYNNEPAYDQGGWAGSNYYNIEYHYDGEYAYDTGNYYPTLTDGYLPTHASYNADGSTYEALWCPSCGAEVSLAMDRCPVCGYFIQ